MLDCGYFLRVRDKLTSPLVLSWMFILMFDIAGCHTSQGKGGPLIQRRPDSVKYQCKFGTVERLLDLRKDPKPKLLEKTQAAYPRDCQEYCCQTLSCDLFIWLQKEKHCYLLQCPNLIKCSVIPVNGSVTGTVLHRSSSVVVKGMWLW